ncbi:GIP, partial [Symbiodinium necroappetens]
MGLASGIRDPMLQKLAKCARAKDEANVCRNLHRLLTHKEFTLQVQISFTNIDIKHATKRRDLNKGVLSHLGVERLNQSGHSFCSRLLYTVLPARCYRGDTTIFQLLEDLSQDCLSLLRDGIEVVSGGQTIKFHCDNNIYYLGPTSTQPTSGSSGSSSAASTVLLSEQSNNGEIRELAEQFLAKIKRLAPLQAVTDNAVVDLELLLSSQGLGESHGMALLDSGASHAYRAPKTLEETKEAKQVKVQLADGRHVFLRQTKGGTLLAEDDSGGTILPLGSLVSSLGCKLDWSKRKGLRITHPEHGLLPTKLVGNTPVLREAEALQLIADLEQLELDKLEKNNTDGVLKMMSTEDPQLTWLDHLEEFVQRGERASLRRMLLDEESPVDAVAEAEVVGLIGVDDRILLSDEAGAHYLKSLPINRAMRKRLLKTRWVVHLYNGDEKGEEFARAESEDVTVIRMDVRDSKAYDLRTYGPAARLLLWAAARGQIEGIIGAPPRGAEHGPALFKRMLLVWLVANSGAVLNSLCAPFFCMEAPTWHPLWTSSAWIKFKDEMRFLKYHSVGTPGNMYFMASSLGLSDGMDIEEAAIMSLNYETPAPSWPVPLKLGIAQAILNWRRSDLRRHEATLCKIVGPRELNAKDLAYWETHVRNNHVPYDRRCQTCVRGSATGRAHRRCLTPSAYTLSLDICGPMRTRGESQEGKKFRYLLVGAYSHPRLDLPKDHKMPAVEEEYDIEPELDPFEEEDKTDEPPEEEDEEQKALNERFKRIYKDIGDDIECQTLNFAVPMTSRTSKEVRAKIQHIYLQLRQHGLPLVRIHSDRGLELKAKETRSWMADRDILATTGESQQPQQNGRAEALVREIKRRVKVLLRTSGLPATCWPVAAEFAARRQRDLALGNYEDKDLAFGAPTHVKYKRFGEGGRYDLLERWKEGLFVGYSNDVKSGRVVRHGDGSYTTSVHIRPYLVDSDDLVQLGPHEVELPLPERRTRGKTTLAKALVDANNDIDNLAKSFLDNNQFKPEHVVELWKHLKAKARPTSRTTQGEGLQWLIGQYTYGSQCGIVNDTYLHPAATSYLVRAFKEMTGRDDFTALLLTENVGMKCHRDVHNNGARSNWLLPLQQCNEGGGVWIESSPDTYSYDDEWRELPKGGWRRGRVHELQPGVPLEINPKRYHATEPWTGTRLVITAYTPRTTSMKPDAYETLCEFGFNPPPLPPRVPDQLQQSVLKMLTMTEAKDEPEAVMFLVNEVEEEKRERARDVSRELRQLQDDVLNRLKERREWLREFLAEEEILAEELNIVGEAINEEIEGVNGAVRDLIKDVEEQIQKTEDKCHNLYLKVANVNDDKEIGDIEEYLSNLKKDLDVMLDVPLDQVRRNLDKWVDPLRKELANLEEKTDAIERRPIAEARALEREGKLILIPGKVVCTVKPPPPPDTTAPKEQQPRWKRKARVVICGNYAGQWHDPNDLFAAGASAEGLRLALALAALWPTNRPTYGVLPPKVLLQAGLVEPEVVFIVKRALYGLRESPALWAAHRTEVLKELVVENGDGRIFLKQMMTDSELWMILEEPKAGGQPTLKGILVTYVDDILYLADNPVINLLHGRIGAIWPCSPLEYATDGLRYLGMELKQEEGFFTLSQEAYIANLVRLHGLDVDVSAGLPCPKEWIQEDDAEAEEENYSSSELMMAQKVTGECLWMAYRTRPDILYATNYMAAMTTKRPVKVYQIGLKVMSYLNATAGLKLKAELLEGSNCALLVQSTEAMLREILPATSTPTLYIDNQAASNLLNGSSGSWRTRHLRIRHAYVMDRVKSGELYVQHLAGEDQPADLPTKLHSKARLLHLLGTWGMIGLAGLNEKKGLQCLKLGCVFLLLLAVQSLAVSAAKEPLPTVGTMELFVLLILTCISAVALWEAGKALGTWAYLRLFGSKRERKIRKLKELARIAAEAEIERHEGLEPSSETSRHQDPAFVGQFGNETSRLRMASSL